MLTLTHGELFAGYGGLGLAVEEVFGAELAWYAEYDPAASKIMAHHWPDRTNYGDVTQVDWATVPPVDIISGGSPCQDLSLAGRRQGMTAGTRSNLWESMREAIATIKPTYVIWENVRGAYSAKATSSSDLEPGAGSLGDGRGGHLRALGRVLGDLADLGYDCQWRGLRAADVGAPHARFRVFLLATRRDAAPADALRGRSGGRADIPSGSSAARADATAYGADHRPSGACATTQDAHVTAGSQRGIPAPGQAQSGRARADAGRLGGTPATNPADHGQSPLVAGGPEPQSARPAGRSKEAPVDTTGARPRGREYGGAGRGDAKEDGRGRLEPQRSGSEPSGTDWGDYRPAIERWEAVRGTAPAPTELTIKGKHRLSPAFTEWMMGLPDGWVTNVPDISRNDQLKACGNGVVPQQAAAALRHMLEVAPAANLIGVAV